MAIRLLPVILVLMLFTGAAVAAAVAVAGWVRGSGEWPCGRSQSYATPQHYKCSLCC